MSDILKLMPYVRNYEKKIIELLFICLFWDFLVMRSEVTIIKYGLVCLFVCFLGRGGGDRGSD